MIHPRWLLPSLEMALPATLIVLSPLRRSRNTAQGRDASPVRQLHQCHRILTDGHDAPMARWAKGLTSVQTAIALSTTALVIARAAKILK